MRKLSAPAVALVRGVCGGAWFCAGSALGGRRWPAVFVARTRLAHRDPDYPLGVAGMGLAVDDEGGGLRHLLDEVGAVPGPVLVTGDNHGYLGVAQ